MIVAPIPVEPWWHFLVPHLARIADDAIITFIVVAMRLWSNKEHRATAAKVEEIHRQLNGNGNGKVKD